MDGKATAFVEQFSATLYAQWAQQSNNKDLFWKTPKFLHQVLEEGVAKLPKVPLKGHLTRDLARFVGLLRTQLEQKHREFQAQTPTEEATDNGFPLLNEEDVEKALVTATDGAKSKIDSALALDSATAMQIKDSIDSTKLAADFVSIVEQCGVQVRVLQARQYESGGECERKTGFYYEQIARCVDGAARAWCNEARGNWVCDAGSKATTEREKLRIQLQSIVASELLARTPEQQPWTSFFRPEEDLIFRSVDVEKAHAGVYGALLALAVAFPVVYEDDSDSDSTSDDSSSSDDDASSSSSHRRKSLTGKRGLKKIEHVNCVELAKHVVRQVSLAASTSGSSADWYLAVLGAFHNVPKPTRCISSDDDDEEEDDGDGLDGTQQKALLDARADLYARAFMSSQMLWQQRQPEPLRLLEAVLCLRHAAEFMRVERKQTMAAITTATSQLVGVALPSVFWKWMTHVKKMYASEHAVTQSVMKKLTKNKTDKKMTNVLMQESVLLLADLAVLVEQFALFLAQEKEKGHFVVAQTQVPESSAATADADDRVVFFVDNQGGKTKKRGAATDATDANTNARKRERTEA